jgi:hypothetical protein
MQGHGGPPWRVICDRLAHHASRGTNRPAFAILHTLIARQAIPLFDSRLLGRARSWGSAAKERAHLAFGTTSRTRCVADVDADHSTSRRRLALHAVILQLVFVPITGPTKRNAGRRQVRADASTSRQWRDDSRTDFSRDLLRKRLLSHRRPSCQI